MLRGAGYAMNCSMGNMEKGTTNKNNAERQDKADIKE